MKYFEVGVRYQKTTEDGQNKVVTEKFLLDAVSFTEAEERITEEMQQYSNLDIGIISEKITNISEVVTTEDAADKFYKVKMNIATVDESSGRKRKTPQIIIIQAASVDDARKRFDTYIKGWLTDVTLEAVSETKYMDYFRKQ